MVFHVRFLIKIYIKKNLTRLNLILPTILQQKNQHFLKTHHKVKKEPISLYLIY